MITSFGIDGNGTLLFWEMETDWFESGTYQFVLLFVTECIYGVIHLIVDLLYLPVLVVTQFLLPLLVALHEVIKGTPLLRVFLNTCPAGPWQGEIEYGWSEDGLAAVLAGRRLVVILLGLSGESRQFCMGVTIEGMNAWRSRKYGRGSPALEIGLVITIVLLLLLSFSYSAFLFLSHLTLQVGTVLQLTLPVFEGGLETLRGELWRIVGTALADEQHRHNNIIPTISQISPQIGHRATRTTLSRQDWPYEGKKDRLGSILNVKIWVDPMVLMGVIRGPMARLQHNTQNRNTNHHSIHLQAVSLTPPSYRQARMGKRFKQINSQYFINSILKISYPPHFLNSPNPPSCDYPFVHFRWRASGLADLVRLFLVVGEERVININ